MLDAEEVATRLGVGTEEVVQRLRDGLLLAPPSGTGNRVFPSWQFTDPGLTPGLEAVLRAMAVRSPWMRVQFFRTADLRLGDRTPLDVLRSGDIEAVRRVGAAYGEQLAS